MPEDRQFRSEIVCDENLDVIARSSPGIEIQIYRIVQEAINNVVRHASAASVRLNVKVDSDGGFKMLIEDDGVGFDMAGTSPGRGMANIRSRASLIDAEVEWTGRPCGDGTRFILSRRGGSAVIPFGKSASDGN